MSKTLLSSIEKESLWFRLILPHKTKMDARKLSNTHADIRIIFDICFHFFLIFFKFWNFSGGLSRVQRKWGITFLNIPCIFQENSFLKKFRRSSYFRTSEILSYLCRFCHFTKKCDNISLINVTEMLIFEETSSFEKKSIRNTSFG